MPPSPHQPPCDDIGDQLDRLAADGAVQSNCLFQLALMMARIAVEPCPDAYKDEAAQALLGLIRDKPRGNVVRLFGEPASSVVRFAAR